MLEPEWKMMAEPRHGLAVLACTRSSGITLLGCRDGFIDRLATVAAYLATDGRGMHAKLFKYPN